MVKRYICLRCYKVYRSKKNCQKTGCSVLTKEYKPGWIGILSYIFAISGVVTLFILFPLTRSGIFFLSAVIDLAIAGILSSKDDRKIDQIAQHDLAVMYSQFGHLQQPRSPPTTYPSQTQPKQPPTPQYKCTDCGNIISWIQQYNRWYCSTCHNYK